MNKREKILLQIEERYGIVIGESLRKELTKYAIDYPTMIINKNVIKTNKFLHEKLGLDGIVEKSSFGDFMKGQYTFYWPDGISFRLKEFDSELLGDGLYEAGNTTTCFKERSINYSNKKWLVANSHWIKSYTLLIDSKSNLESIRKFKKHFKLDEDINAPLGRFIFAELGKKPLRGVLFNAYIEDCFPASFLISLLEKKYKTGTLFWSKPSLDIVPCERDNKFFTCNNCKYIGKCLYGILPIYLNKGAILVSENRGSSHILEDVSQKARCICGEYENVYNFCRVSEDHKRGAACSRECYEELSSEYSMPDSSITCFYCGEEIEGNGYYIIDYNKFCYSCASQCCSCGEFIRTDESEFYDDESYCLDCFTDRYHRCNSCGEVIGNKEAIDGLCATCFTEHGGYKCYECGKIVYDCEFVNESEDRICRECYREGEHDGK